VPTKSLEQVLDQLNARKNQFTNQSGSRVDALLNRIGRFNIDDADSLVRVHELLLFVRAHPHNLAVLRSAEAILKSFPARIKRLVELGVDLSTLEHPELSGIAGMSVTDTFTFPIVNWLTQRGVDRLSFYWDWFEDEARIGETWPRFMPLLAEDLVEANIPFREWLRKARGNFSEVSWLVEQFNQLEVPDKRRAELFNSQKLYVQWRYRYPDSRTGLRGPISKCFFHDGPFISRKAIQLREELNKPGYEIEKLTEPDGRRAIELARLASTVRYRELYGFTNGDPKAVFRVSLGRGVALEVITPPPQKRLALRASHSAMIYKNGVPIGYFEGLSLFERMESGFNLYYTFREGETAWLYAQILRVMRQLTGVTAFSLDPYQIGFENEEGIQSGAFWFYRKLGFRSGSRDIQKLTEYEEAKIAKRKDYRTPVTTLRRLAQAPMILELDQQREGEWDRFQVRNIGLKVQGLMAEKFHGSAKRFRTYATKTIAKTLGIETGRQNSEPFKDFAVALLLIRDLPQWNTEEKDLLRRIVKAKCSASEETYLRLMQQHERLRTTFIELGSS
jgi:hypothetical protein